MPVFSKILFGLAFVALVAGLAMWKAPWLYSWFGKLPGDIHYEGEHSQVFFPLVSMLVVSGVLTLVVNLIGWLLHKLR